MQTSRPWPPLAVLLDLDDTILDDSSTADDCWRQACQSCLAGLDDVDPSAAFEAICTTKDWYWSDPERHRRGRLNLDVARAEVVALAMGDLAARYPDVPHRMAAAYARFRHATLDLVPGAIETVHWLRTRGCRLALLTNGAAALQRSKISRFGLENLFDVILVEGELGFGKPDPRIYARALEGLRVNPDDTWMVGDNLEWDVFQPQRMGIAGIWVDVRGTGLPHGSATQPARIVRRISELRPVGVASL